MTSLACSIRTDYTVSHYCLVLAGPYVFCGVAFTLAGEVQQVVCLLGKCQMQQMTSLYEMHYMLDNVLRGFDK